MFVTDFRIDNKLNNNMLWSMCMEVERGGGIHLSQGKIGLGVGIYSFIPRGDRAGGVIIYLC